MTEARESAGPNGTTHARHTPGSLCRVSLMARETAASRDFYGTLFGWEFQPGPLRTGSYAWALVDGHEVAGIGQLPPDRHLPVAWTPYFASADVDRTAETVRHSGGTVGVGPLDAEAGRLAIASDPSGAVFGIWRGVTRPGTGITGVPGTPTWIELVTRDTESVVKFYKGVFGYEPEPTVSADPDHVVLRIDGRPVAGVHGVGNALPRDRGPHWLTYFEAAEVDDAVRRVTELGGRLLRAAHDSPYGRVATVADPEGAVFSLIRTVI
jgi:predicted enzyme related to lactoylglutathione lyase